MQGLKIRLAMGWVAGMTLAGSAHGAILDASMARVPRSSEVNLTEEGILDWVHWGYPYTETDINRKAGVLNQISNFELIWNFDNSNAWAFVYQFADHFNGYTWTDGEPVAGVTNTTTGVWAYGIPSIGSGFQLTVPADTTLQTLKVYVGVFAGRGLFTASLSDNSAPAYQNSSLFNFSNGEGGVYTIDFAADGPGQTLTLTWTLMLLMRPDANVTLQAAALTTAGANQPPQVRLTAPGNYHQVPLGDAVVLEATASDLDGSIQRVEFFSGTNRLGEATAPPYTLNWEPPGIGGYTISAAATDDLGLQNESRPLDLFVHTTGGALVGEIATPPAQVNLTTLGTIDWVHWGESTTNLNRKAEVTPQIPDVTSLGVQPLGVYTNNFSEFSWSDGTPRTAASGLAHGVFAYGVDGGFELALPADTQMRRARIYAGLYGGASLFEAYLSDASAPAYHDISLTNVFGSSYAVYTLDYRAASAGQTLVVRHTTERLFDLLYGNVTLQAVTLSDDAIEPPSPVLLSMPVLVGDQVQFSFMARSGFDYVVEHASSPDPGAAWQVLTNVTGTGETATVTHLRGTQRFYRVETR